MAFYDYQGRLIEIFVNVKDFGAKGDGTTNDATSIQNALNSIRSTGGVVYFPEGIYMIESAVQFYSNSSLFFENGATLRQGASINNLIRTFCDQSWTGYNGTHDCIIYGATFDGGEYTTNNTLVGTAHAKNITFKNCIFKNAYGEWHNLEINSSYNVKVINCIFEGARKTTERAELIQIDSAYHSSSYPWSINSDNTVCKLIEIAGCIFDNSLATAVGQHSNSVHDLIKIHDNHFTNITATRGIIFLSGATNLDIYNNTFDGGVLGIGSGDSSWYIHDNRFVNVSTAINGTTSVSHANMINGTYTGPAGADGEDGADGKSAYEYAVDGGYTGTEAEFAEKLAEEGVSDVQVNGTSILANGVVKLGQGFKTDNSTGLTGIDWASADNTKAGASQSKAINPYQQHRSAFYGLAKAAGDATQSASSNAVGAYTDEAKVAIQKMLGIYEAPWELIREDTFTNETAANHTISVDGNGNPFELTDIVMQFELPQQENESKISGYIQFYDGSTLKAQSTWLNTTQAAAATGSGSYVIVRNEQGLIFNVTKQVTSNSNAGNLFMVHRSGFTTINSGVFFDANFKITKAVINGITGTGHYRLYGKRNWQ